MTAEIAIFLSLGLKTIEQLLVLVEKGRPLLNDSIDPQVLSDIDAGLKSAASRAHALLDKLSEPTISSTT